MKPMTERELLSRVDNPRGTSVFDVRKAYCEFLESHGFYDAARALEREWNGGNYDYADEL